MAGVHIPPTISTGCTELDTAWAAYAQPIFEGGILIPDTEDDLNWHAFLGHSIDMQGFRAAEFVGVDALTKTAPGFRPLKEQGIGLREMAHLWEVEPIQEHLMAVTRRGPSEDIEPTLQQLRLHGGAVGQTLAAAYAAFPYRKTNGGIRAYLQNSAKLAPNQYSFRSWLASESENAGASEFPPADFRAAANNGDRSIEEHLMARLEQTFYMVGPTMAAYMICDWQLWLWHQGLTGVFEAYKPDMFHERFAHKYGAGVIPEERRAFIRWWLDLYPSIPPRLLNECIWLAVEHGMVEI